MTSTQRPRATITEEFRNWGAINQDAAKRLAEGTDLALPIRAFFAAVARANRIGHAEFGKDELRIVLAVRRRGQDIIEPPSRQQVWQAIRRAKELDLIDDESCQRCLVLPLHLWDKGVGGSNCSAHGLGKRWTTHR